MSNGTFILFRVHSQTGLNWSLVYEGNWELTQVAIMVRWVGRLWNQTFWLPSLNSSGIPGLHLGRLFALSMPHFPELHNWVSKYPHCEDKGQHMKCFLKSLTLDRYLTNITFAMTSSLEPVYVSLFISSGSHSSHPKGSSLKTPSLTLPYVFVFQRPGEPSTLSWKSSQIFEPQLISQLLTYLLQPQY